MGLESVTHLDDLDATNPLGTDPRSEGDDHIRNIKSMLLTDFPNISGVVTSTHSELNFADVTAGTLTASKAIVVDSSSKIDNLKVDNIDINGNTISSTDTNGSVTITPHGTGDIILDGQKWPQADGTANYLLKTDGSGQLSWVENLAEDWATKTDGAVASSATAAASSATAAAASADSFDDTYLGAKSSDPSTDNDGDALGAGDLYYNTSSSTLQVYSGSAWATAALSSSGFATLTGSETLTNKTLTSPVIDGTWTSYTTSTGKALVMGF